MYHFNPTILGCSEAARSGHLDTAERKLGKLAKTKKFEVCSIVQCTTKVYAKNHKKDWNGTDISIGQIIAGWNIKDASIDCKGHERTEVYSAFLSSLVSSPTAKSWRRCGLAYSVEKRGLPSMLPTPMSCSSLSSYNTGSEINAASNKHLDPQVHVETEQQVISYTSAESFDPATSGSSPPTRVADNVNHESNADDEVVRRITIGDRPIPSLVQRPIPQASLRVMAVPSDKSLWGTAHRILPVPVFVLIFLFCCHRSFASKNRKRASTKKPSKPFPTFSAPVISWVVPPSKPFQIFSIPDVFSWPLDRLKTVDDRPAEPRAGKPSRRQKLTDPNKPALPAAAPVPDRGAAAALERRSGQKRPGQTGGREGQAAAAVCDSSGRGPQLGGRDRGPAARGLEAVSGGGAAGAGAVSAADGPGARQTGAGWVRGSPCGLYNGCNSDANLCFMNAALQVDSCPGGERERERKRERKGGREGGRLSRWTRDS